MWYLYVLFCDEKTFYVGITNNISQRVQQHRNGDSFFTKKFSRIELVYGERYNLQTEAAQREKQLKGWSHAKKQMLVDGKIGINACTELLKNL